MKSQIKLLDENLQLDDEAYAMLLVRICEWTATHMVIAQILMPSDKFSSHIYHHHITLKCWKKGHNYHKIEWSAEENSRDAKY